MYSVKKHRDISYYGNIIRKIGHGTYGTVFATDRNYAIKRIDNHMPYNIVSRSAAIEYNSLSKIKSPFVVPLVDFIYNKQCEYTYIVMSLAESDLLDTIISFLSHGYCFENVENIFLSICIGLAAIHNAGIAHLDLKPTNILIHKNGLWITDFGVSEDFICNTSNTGIAGTLPYRPPEVFFGDKIGLPADIWSLGLIFLDLLCAEIGIKNPIHKGVELNIVVKFIFDNIGIPNEETWPGVTSLPHWNQYSNLENTIKPVYYGNIFEELLNNGIRPEAISLLKRILQLNPSTRPNIFEILSDPYFSNMQQLQLVPKKIPCWEQIINYALYPTNGWIKKDTDILDTIVMKFKLLFKLSTIDIEDKNLETNADYASSWIIKRRKFVGWLIDTKGYVIGRYTTGLIFYLCDLIMSNEVIATKNIKCIGYAAIYCGILFFSHQVSIADLGNRANSMYTNEELADMVNRILSLTDHRLGVTTTPIFLDELVTKYNGNWDLVEPLWYLIQTTTLVYRITPNKLATDIWTLSKEIEIGARSNNLSEMKSLISLALTYYRNISKTLIVPPAIHEYFAN